MFLLRHAGEASARHRVLVFVSVIDFVIIREEAFIVELDRVVSDFRHDLILGDLEMHIANIDMDRKLLASALNPDAIIR